jgi:hypothetical protein
VQPPSHGVRGMDDDMFSPSHSGGFGGGRLKSKQHIPWSREEVEALVEGVARCGGGRWAEIKKLGFSCIWGRSAVDLKDKWRNITRIAATPVRRNEDKEGMKTVYRRRELPAELLERVRSLVELHAIKAAEVPQLTERPAARPLRRAEAFGELSSDLS